MTALAWVRCAWAQLLFLAAPPRTAALQSQTGNPWCWSAAGWPPDQGGTHTPTSSPEMSVSCRGEPSLESPSTRATESGGSREGKGGKNPGCAPQLRVQTVGGLLWCEVGRGVPLTWLPVWRSRIYSPLAYLSSPQVKAQQDFSLGLNEMIGKGKSDHLSTIVKLSFSRDVLLFISFCLLASSL